MKYCFGDIVVVEENLIGVIVKSWVTNHKGKTYNNYDVYVRVYNGIKNYKEDLQKGRCALWHLKNFKMQFQITKTT